MKEVVSTNDNETVVCAATGAEKECAKGAIPRGWTRQGGKVYSPDGWAKTFRACCLTLPVASVLEGWDAGDWSQETCRQGWQAFRATLRTSFSDAARVLNWAMRELAALDSLPLAPSKKTEGAVTLPGWPLPSAALYKRLYDGMRAAAPDLDSQTVNSLRQRALKRYNEDRWDMRVRQTVSLPTFRVPTPLPLPPACLRGGGFSLEDGRPLLQIRLGNRQRFTLRLTGGHNFHRQLTGLKRVLAGDGCLAEVVLREQSAGGGHQNGGEARAAPKAGKHPTRIMAGLVVWLPRGRAAVTEAEVVVKTHAEGLWRVFFEGREQLWMLHEDQIRREHAAHAARLQRLSDDTKFERRRPRRNRAGLASRRETLCDNHARRINDFLHKASAMLVNFASRQRAGAIRYDDGCADWCPKFPWFKLRALVKQKAEAIGITFTHETSSAETEDE